MRSIVTVLCLVLGSAGVAAPTSFASRAQWVLGGPGGWDYLTLDPAKPRLFIARGDRVLVVSTTDGTLLGTIPHTDGVHGVALAADLGRGFISDGRADAVTVFDLTSLQPVATYPVSGHNPDAILYHAATRHLFTFNGQSHDITMLDAATGTVITTTPAGGKPEFAQADDGGHVFYNIEDTAELGELDAATGTRLATWQLPGCEQPTGLAIDIARARLFSTCGNGRLMVTDARNGRHVATLPIGAGPDAAAYDASRRLVFSSNGRDGTLTVIRAGYADHYAVLATVPTQTSARTMALDTAAHRIYTVAADFGPVPEPTAEEPHPRPPVIDDSFRVLVIGE